MSGCSGDDNRAIDDELAMVMLQGYSELASDTIDQLKESQVRLKKELEIFNKRMEELKKKWNSDYEEQ